LHEVDVIRLTACKRRLEGILVLIGNIADVNDCPELEIVHDSLMNTITEMRAALRTNGEDLEQL